MNEETLTFAERAECVMAACFRGLHNHRGKLERHERYWIATCHHSLSSYDSNDLTRLVLAAHKFHVRVEVQPANIKVLRIMLHDRQREGTATWDRHPTIEDAIENYERGGRIVGRIKTTLAVLRGYEPAEVRAAKARIFLEGGQP